MAIYFTSDWHLWHANIIRYAKRPFENIEHMNQTILSNFFEKVKRNATVYFLGDFAFGIKYRYEEIKSVLEEITSHCKFHVILGNHDNDLRYLFEERCESVSPLKEVSIGGKRVTLCHYPMCSFNRSHHNSWQLYGHHHWDTNDFIKGKRYNVGLEANDYKPITFKELVLKMDQRDNNWDYKPPEKRGM